MRKTTLFLKGRWRAALLILLLCAAGMTNALAQMFTEGDLSYLINGNSVTVLGHVDGTSAAGSLSIPENVSHEGVSYAVTSIGGSAFYNCSQLESIFLPNSLISIGDYAFRGVSGITSIIIPNSVTSLGAGTFYGCSSLENVSLGNSVTSIKSHTFYNCGLLASLTIPNSVTSIGNYAFYGCALLEEMVVPDSVASIGSYAFTNCNNLTSITLGNGVTTISDHTFYNTGHSSGCSITLGDNVTSIGDYAFSQCKLTTFTLPNSVISMGNNAFSNCSSLTSFTFSNSLMTIGEKAFYSCSGLTSIVLPNSVTSIGSNAFGNCTSLGSFTIPSSVNYIGGDVFYGCNNLITLIYDATNCTMGGQLLFYQYSTLLNLTIGENVQTIPQRLLLDFPGLQQIVVAEGNTVFDSRNNCNAVIRTSTNELIIGCKNTFIPNTVTSIGDYAFYYRTGLTSIIIPNSVITIGNHAFEHCSGLISVTIPDSVTTIGDSAFKECTGLLSFTIGSSVTSIGLVAFAYCGNITTLNYNATNCTIAVSIGGTRWLHRTSLSEVNIGENVQVLPNYFVYGQSNITSVIIPNSVTTIGKAALGGCGFASINIPNSVTSIGESAFSGCSSLTSVTLPNTLTTIENGTFQNCNNLNAITIPNSVTSIGNYVFSNNALSSITIPASVVSIGDGAFYSCSGLTSITLPNTMASIGDYMFYNCNNLPSITIPDSVVTIGEKAFSSCTSLTSLVIPDSVVTIKWNAFESCNGLTSVTIGSSVASIYSEAFVNCDNIASITVLAETPPSLGSAVFMAVLSGIPVFVPCGKLGAYQASNQWNFFTNLIAVCPPCEITAIASPEEGGTVEGAGTYTQLTTCTLTATDSTGYHFVNWTVDGEEVSTEPTYSFEVIEDANYVANFELNSYNIAVTANPEAGGTVTGAGTYDHFSTCTLTATPSTGYHFVNWTLGGEVVSSSPTYSFEVTGPVDYMANFELNSYEITATANPTEGGTVEGMGVYQHFSTCTLTATPSTGYHFVNWTLGSEVVSSSPTYSFEVTGPADYVANFELNSYNIAVTANPEAGGTVTGAGTYNHFETVTLTATANTGYHFVNWTLGGEVVSSSPTFSFEVTEARDYVAHFGPDSYAVTATVSPTAGGTVAGGGVYDYGTACTLTATPSTGYHFVNWTLGGEVVSSSPTYSFEVTGPADYMANFELNNYEITATANPTEGGTVTGAGTYDHGATCTLTAIANEGYVFVHWTEGGAVVTDGDSYSFTATGDRDLSANFVRAYHWDVDPHGYPNTMTIVGVVRIDGEEQAVGTLELGAFCGGECRGRERLTGQYYQSHGHYFVFMTVYGEDGDEIGFMLYDQTLDAELDLVCASMSFGTNVTYGNPFDPYVFDFFSPQAEVTQATDFAQGWNWWSTYVEADDLFDQLKAGLGANATQIKSSTTFVNYFNGMWIGGLSSIGNESCYLIKANNACTLEMTGNPAAPANHPITINPNWNWIGYPNMGAQSVANAFSNFTPANGDQVKSQNAFATYYGGMWVGGLNTITPGMGLLYKSNSAETKTLIYSEANRSEDLAENVTNENNHWTANYYAYPSNMTMMAVVELDDVELQGENYEVAAFADGECRGSARLMYVEPLNRYMAFLTIVGDEASELRFSLYDSETGIVETQNFASLQYETNATIGSLKTPYVIRFRSTTGIDEWANNINIFPNPVNRGEQFSLGLPAVETLRATSVEIINAMGAVVETWRAASLQTVTAPNVAGVYTLRITVEGKGICYRKLVVK